MKQEADVIVVGSGAGGAAVAMELAAGGRDVLILEKGRRHEAFSGTHLGAALMADRLGMRFSNEGLQCVRAITTGGTTMLYCGTFSDPPSFIRTRLGIDLSREVEEIKKSAGVRKLPDKFIEGSGSIIMEAADSLGYRWEIFEKFIDPEKCRTGCSACMMGCPFDAKWTARRYIEDAVRHGASIVQPVTVDRVTHVNGRATGVSGRCGLKSVEFRAPVVILAAGGMGTAPILNRTGIREAGKGIFIDPLVFVGGEYAGNRPSAATRLNPQMSLGTWEFHESDGILLSPLVDPWVIFCAQMAMVSIPKVLKIMKYRRWMSIMVKIKDDLAGEIFPDGSFSKPLTDADRKKLDLGAEIASEILIKAGCRPGSLVRGPVRGAHPGGACRIGEVVDINLETGINSLFVSDASVFPEALGMPVVAAVMAMGKRLARRILENGRNP